MGSVVKAVGGLFGGGGKGKAPKLDLGAYDYRQKVQDRVKPAREATLGLISQLQQQSQGKGPSLATAQLKSAQDRNLSQMLAAAAAQRGGNAASRQRQLIQAQSDMGRQLAQDSAQAKLQEQLQAQSLLGTTGLAQQGQDVQQIMEPGRLYTQGVGAQYAADVEQNKVNQQQQADIFGGLLGAAAPIVASAVPGIGSWASGLAGKLFSKTPVGTSAGGGGASIGGKVASANPFAEGGIVGTPEEEMRKAFANAVASKSAAAIPVTAESAFNPAANVAGPGAITDSEATDTVPAKLSPGELVVPKTVVSAGPSAVKSFAEAVLQNQPKNSTAVGGFGAIISAQQELEKRLKKLEGKKGK